MKKKKKKVKKKKRVSNYEKSMKLFCMDIYIYEVKKRKKRD